MATILRHMEKNPNTNLAARLRDCNQTRVSAATGHDQSQISKLVNGRMKPSRDFALRLATHFKVSTDQIFAVCEHLMERRRTQTKRELKAGMKPKRGRKS